MHFSIIEEFVSFHLGGKYTDGSIQNAKQFALSCSSMVDENSIFWCSFQSNCFADVVTETDKFQSTLEDMKKILQENGFHIANLKHNMRNSKPISSILVGNTYGSLKVTEHVNHLQSTVEGADPCVIPIHVNDLKTGLNKTLQEALESKRLTGGIVLLHGGTHYTSSDLKMELDNLNTKYQVRLFDPEVQGEVVCIQEFMAYLKNSNNEILVCNQEYMVGGECCNLVFLMSDSNRTDANLRCSLFRATQHLTVIHMMDERYPAFNTLDGFLVNPQFLRCLKQPTRRGCYLLKCLTCLNTQKRRGRFGFLDENDFIICHSCYYSCHANHNIEQVVADLSMKCNCKTSAKCAIYNN